MSKPLSVGWEEWVSFPKLGLPAIKAKVDTGAKTSSLHAHSMEVYGKNKDRIRFKVNPIPDEPHVEMMCTAKLVGRREITSSNGESEYRYIIRTPIKVGNHKWTIDVSLSNREGMTYRALLGRAALTEQVTVMPFESFINPVLSYDVYDDMIEDQKTFQRALSIAILSREPDNYSTRRLVEAAEERGHKVHVIDTLRCYLDINSDAPVVHLDGKPLPRFDAIIPRIGASVSSYGMSVVRQFEMMGTYCLNPSLAIGCSRDKLYAHQLLSRRHVPMPKTTFARSPKDTKAVVELIGKAPMILKVAQSTQGRGVVLAETKKAAESVIMAFQGVDSNILVQEFIPEAGGADIRCFVIGNKVVAAMKRQGAEGEYRSNLHLGGRAVKVKISAEERKLAAKAAKALGLRVAGVDIIRANDGPKVIEVNSSPGLEGIEQTSGKDIAGLVVEYLERHARPMRYSSRRMLS